MSDPIHEEPRTAEQVEQDHVDAIKTIPHVERETIELRQHTLGLDPYVLIRAVKVDPDDEGDDGFRLKVEYGGGASGGELAALYVLNLPAAQNPLTAAIKAVIDANPDDDAVLATLRLFAEFCDVPMPESGR